MKLSICDTILSFRFVPEIIKFTVLKYQKVIIHKQQDVVGIGVKSGRLLEEALFEELLLI